MRTETPQEALKGTQKNFLNGLKYGFEPISMRVSAPRLSTHIPTHLKLRIKIILAIPQFGRLKSAFIVHFDRARTAPRVMLSPMAKFVLVLSRISRGSQVELTCAVTGESEGWLGITRRFASQEEAEEALRKNRCNPSSRALLQFASRRERCNHCDFRQQLGRDRTAGPIPLESWQEGKSHGHIPR
jgi:hypothetical protein